MFDRRKALYEAMSKGVEEKKITAAERRRVVFALMWRPGLRQEIFDMVDQELIANSLMTSDGDVPEGEGFQSTWLLIIELLIQFLPIILEFLKKRNA